MKHVFGESERGLDSLTVCLCAVMISSRSPAGLKLVLTRQPWIYPSLISLPEVKTHSWSHRLYCWSNLFAVTVPREKNQRAQARSCQEDWCVPKNPHQCVFSFRASDVGSQEETIHWKKNYIYILKYVPSGSFVDHKLETTFFLFWSRWIVKLVLHSQTHCCFSLSRQKNACIYWPWKDGHRFVPSEEMSLLVISIGEPPPFGWG